MNPVTHWLLHGFYFKALNSIPDRPFVVCFEMDPVKLEGCPRHCDIHGTDLSPVGPHRAVAMCPWRLGVS